jgi:hypothetical protein
LGDACWHQFHQNITLEISGMKGERRNIDKGIASSF